MYRRSCLSGRPSYPEKRKGAYRAQMKYKTHVRTHFFILTLAAFLTAFSAGGCGTPIKTESLKMTGMYFDTVIQIEAWGTDRAVLDHCEEMCEYFEGILSPSIETSEVSQINRAQGAPVTVSDETAELIRLGIYYGGLSEGRFDITTAPASDLWNFKENPDGVLPGSEALQEAVSHIDYRCIQIDGRTVTLTDPEARIDLGGIAKGYIADSLKDYLKDAGVEHAVINLGGNVLALGGKYDGTSFHIGIQKPFAADGTLLGSVSLSDQSLVSSGDYERYFEKDGVIYHHILDPFTGYPVQNDLDQVTILSERSVDGDALSTTCYILGLEEGMKLIQGINGVEAVFVTKDGKIHTTDDQILSLE